MAYDLGDQPMDPTDDFPVNNAHEHFRGWTPDIFDDRRINPILDTIIYIYIYLCIYILLYTIVYIIYTYVYIILNNIYIII